MKGRSCGGGNGAEPVLALADGTRWALLGADETARATVAEIAEVMGLEPDAAPARRMLVRTEGANGRAAPPDRDALTDHDAVCVLKPVGEDDGPAIRLLLVSLALGRQIQAKGGLLLHGALAAREGRGIVFAGPGSIGKTTTSRRLPPPWEALSDDTTLVVRGPTGGYWAHPWPTWSRFLLGDATGRWDTRRSVRLAGIFFLSQAATDTIEPISGAGQATALLVENSDQVGHPMRLVEGLEAVRGHRLERFETSAALARAVPMFFLHLSLTGKFWEDVEAVLGLAREERPGR